MLFSQNFSRDFDGEKERFSYGCRNIHFLQMALIYHVFGTHFQCKGWTEAFTGPVPPLATQEHFICWDERHRVQWSSLCNKNGETLKWILWQFIIWEILDHLYLHGVIVNLFVRKLEHPHIVKFHGASLLKEAGTTRVILVLEKCKGNLKSQIFAHPEAAPEKPRILMSLEKYVDGRGRSLMLLRSFTNRGLSTGTSS